ncbi:hypothetical protein EDM68_01360 [Candidatus Uhrbacteria bacterium]|nr:MAG: hypothetical protein EDM68_01360 [Candidatus Uhrbacteria bacterium]
MAKKNPLREMLKKALDHVKPRHGTTVEGELRPVDADELIEALGCEELMATPIEHLPQSKRASAEAVLLVCTMHTGDHEHEKLADALERVIARLDSMADMRAAEMQDSAA